MSDRQPTYVEKLRDPRWQRKRLEILSRDNFTCLWCGETTKPLNVHHRYYVARRDPWEYPNGALQTVCEDCHSAEKNGDTDWQRLGQLPEWEQSVCGLTDLIGEKRLRQLLDELEYAAPEFGVPPTELLDVFMDFLHHSWTTAKGTKREHYYIKKQKGG